MSRFLGVVWGLAALWIGYLAASIALGPKADASGWWLAAVFAGGAALCAWQAWREWNAPGVSLPRPAAPAARSQQPVPPAEPAPGAWRGDPVRLETQIEALKAAGLDMAPGRTMDELLTSWRREEYESDPYNLILFMYGSEMEEEPWGRFFCQRGWNFDFECLSETGDYARAFREIVRITGQPQRVTDLSDNFDLAARTCEITYTIDGRPAAISARVDNDWADPAAVARFILDLEATIADGRHFWAAENGQAAILFCLADDEADKINALRPGILTRYVRR